jgi:cyclopropane fatty-acyl-phospholipid synthase-like methyltransferase
MATIAAQFGAVPADSLEPVAAAVRICYSLLDVAPLCGVTDFTDGKYIDGQNDAAAYAAAQRRQAEYLLNQVRCRTGIRLLDIGCGYGRVLEQATERGAMATGITISPLQVASCRSRGLDVRELNYRNIFRGVADSWAGEFDAIVANGSLEHFVQVSDAAEGRADAIYHEMFAICRRLLTDGGRFVTTAIHFREAQQFDPNAILRGPEAHRRLSDEYQMALLVRSFGGWYPEPGQLARCADPSFELVAEEDGTEDYRRTSEYWLRRLQLSAAFNPRVWRAIAGKAWERPRETRDMLRSHLWDQTWYWQFRAPAPMRLRRQTWVAR